MLQPGSLSPGSDCLHNWLIMGNSNVYYRNNGDYQREGLKQFVPFICRCKGFNRVWTRRLLLLTSNRFTPLWRKTFFWWFSHPIADLCHATVRWCKVSLVHMNASNMDKQGMKNLKLEGIQQNKREKSNIWNMSIISTWSSSSSSPPQGDVQEAPWQMPKMPQLALFDAKKRQFLIWAPSRLSKIIGLPVCRHPAEETHFRLPVSAISLFRSPPRAGDLH